MYGSLFKLSTAEEAAQENPGLGSLLLVTREGHHVGSGYGVHKFWVPEGFEVAAASVTH